MNITGHPFIDGGIVAAAALIERYEEREVPSLQQLKEEDLLTAIDLAQKHWFQQSFKKEVKQTDKPLFCFLLQEILPGSSWDQTKTVKDVSEFSDKLVNYIQTIKDAIKAPPIGRCFLTGKEAHVLASKTHIPMLSSGAERPNCYPNLAQGQLVNGYLALAVLLSPFSAEKTVNADGKGSECLLYHACDWSLGLEIVRRNFETFELLLAANVFEIYGKRQKANQHVGNWRSAMRMMIRASDNLPAQSRAPTVIWHYNASNQSSHYDCLSTSVELESLLDQRRQNPWMQGEMMRSSDRICRAILCGNSIIRQSVFLRSEPPFGKPNAKKADWINVPTACPHWLFQRLYAIEVLDMSQSFLDAIEETASHLINDKEAVRLCLKSRGRLPIEMLVNRYKVPRPLVLRISQEPGQWLDFLKAALLWREKHPFPPQPPTVHTPGELERLIVDCAPRLAHFKSYRAAAYQLNKPIGSKYRGAWLHLLSRGAGTWEDFLAFNPIEEALGTVDYAQTRLRKDYLLAYLWACSHESPDGEELNPEEDIESEEEDEFEILLSDEEWDENAEPAEELEELTL